MKIIESYILGKTQNQLECEDGIVLTDAYLAVVDGATSRVPLPWSTIRSGRIAMLNVTKTITEAAPRLKADEMMLCLERSLRDAYGEHYIDAVRCDDYKMFANLVIYSDHRKQLWRFGDCRININGVTYPFNKPVDEKIADYRSQLISKLISDGVSVESLIQNDLTIPYLENMLKEALALANTDDEMGYPVLNGINSALDKIEVLTVKEGDEVIIASDGYPVVLPTLAESEEYLENALKNDPLFYKTHKSVKGLKGTNLSFDDRAYIRFTV